MMTRGAGKLEAESRNYISSVNRVLVYEMGQSSPSPRAIGNEWGKELGPPEVVP